MSADFRNRYRRLYLLLTFDERKEILQFAFNQLDTHFIDLHLSEHTLDHPLLFRCWCYNLVAQIVTDAPFNTDFFQDPSFVVNYPYSCYSSAEALLFEFSNKRDAYLACASFTSRLVEFFCAYISERQPRFSACFDY